MSQRHGWDIRTRMLAISLGPALLLTLLLTAYFTYSRLQDLRQELTHTGQLIADQLAPAAEYGVIAGNTPVLQKLLQATLDTPHVRFIEVRDRNDNILVYVEQLPGALQNAAPIDIFHSTIQRQRIALASDPLLDGASEGDGQSGEDYLGRVVVGMSNDAFSQRQQEILLKAALLAAFALILTFLVARRLAQRLSAPISTMGQAVEAIQSGDYKTSLPILDDGEIGDLARHINNLASGLDRASREQEQAISQLISAREEAEQANRAKSDFLAMMSHELRTPMNGVLGMLQLLETTEQTREQAEYTALATESTEHLLKVINDILDFSRIERGALELECIPFNLLELVQGSALVFQHSAQQRGLALELQIQAGLENIEVCGDPTRIRQILVNLLGNALKFTEEGAIHLSLEWQALDHDVLWLTCAVHDSGIGISPERLEHMFDAFQQADSSISRRYGGTGLGLAIARTLAERMGGTLQAESKEGSGSTFTLEIPLPFQQSPAHRQQAARAGAQGRGGGGGRLQADVRQRRPAGQGLGHDPLDVLAIGAAQGQARWTGEGAAATGELLAELDALHQVGTGVEMEDRHQPLVDRHRLGEAPGPGQAEDGLAFLREHVGHSRDPALGTHRHAFQDHVVEAGEEDEALAHLVAYVDEAAGVAGAVLEADDVLAVGQGNQDVRGDVVPVDRRVVVDHHRQVGAAGHAAEMLGGLVRLGGIDQRRHHHDAVDADPLHRLGHLRRAGAGELGDPADHRHAAAGGILGDLGDGHLLLDGQRGVLADAAAYHQPGHAVAHQVGDDRVGFLQVH